MGYKMNKGIQIKADLYSRPNALNGKYELCQLYYLLNLDEIKDTDLFYLESLQVRANSADEIIADAEKEGKDTSDPEVLKALGEEINKLGTLVHKRDSIIAAIYVSSRVIISFGIGIGIWSLVFSKSFLSFFIYGIVVGFIISLFIIFPVIAKQRIKEKIKDIIFSIGALIIPIALGIGVIGIIAWLVKILFFNK